MARRIICRVFVFVIVAAFLAGCAGSEPAYYPQINGASVRAGPESVIAKLKYFTAPPNGAYPGDNLIVGPDKNLWYTNPPNAATGNLYGISKYTAAGTKTYPVPPLCRHCGPIEPTSLVSGPDGRIWFGTALSYVIGVIDTRGKVKYFNGPSPYCGPYLCDIVLGAVVGQDIWFTFQSLSSSFFYSLGAGYIDSSTGAAKSEGGGIHDTPPSQIALGPDGHLWFGAGTEIVRMDPYGNAELIYTYPPMNVGSIIAGPDKNMWFVSDGESQVVGRIKTDGKILSEVSLGPGAITHQLIAASDRSVWITTNTGIVRMTSAKHFTSIAVPKRQRQRCQPAGIAVGSDGSVWFSSIAWQKSCSHGIATVVPGSEGAKP